MASSYASESSEVSMATIELSAGKIEYMDSGGPGEVIVFLHGLVMDGSLWRHVVSELRASYRCIVPNLPFGSHRLPMNADADLSPHGIACLEAEFLEKLDLRNVTLVGNDSGLLQITAVEYPERIARLVIISCEAFENFPPGLPGRGLALAARIPGGLNLLAQSMRVRPFRRLPLAYGWMAKRAIPDKIVDGWLRPALSQRKIRRDLIKYILAAKKGTMLTAAEQLHSFKGPALIVWAVEDRVMPPAHGHRLASILPDSRLVEIEDSYTLIPEDQPVKLAACIRDFITAEVINDN